MSFASPRWLWLLVMVAPWLLIEWRAARRAADSLGRLVGRRVGHTLLRQCRPGHRRAGILLRIGAFVLLAFGAAGPEWGLGLVRRSASGSDVVLLVDVSASMDVRDVPPSRIEEARREALAVLDRLAGSRVGVVAFAGDAVRLCPLTLDRGAVRLVLESLGTGVVSDPGTDLGRGLKMAARLLPGGRRSEQVIVLWTDGEDLERGAGDAMEALARSGYRVLTVGVGTPAGDVVPVLDERGATVDVKRDAKGDVVQSRLDERLLRTLARRTGGTYIAASRPGGELPRLLSALGAVSHGVRGDRLVERPIARFPWFAALAALLLAVELGRARRRGLEGAAEVAPPPEAARVPAQRTTRSATRRRVAAVAVLVGMGLAAAETGYGQTAWVKGDRAFRQRRFALAESLYARRAGRVGPAAVRVNRATAAALAGKGTAAESLLSGLIETGGTVGSTAAYNLGTLQAGRGEYDTAIKSLRRALELDPGNGDARFNFELAMRRRRQPQGSPPPTRGGAPSPQRTTPEPMPSAPGLSPPPSPSASSSRNPRSPHGPDGMDPQTAEQLLGSLGELERLERQRRRAVSPPREKRGRDW